MLLMSGGASAGGPADSLVVTLDGFVLSVQRTTASRPASEAPAISQGVRSPDRAGVREPTACPHPAQNRAVADSGAPQAVHRAPVLGAPQFEQNAPVAGAAQAGQGVGLVLVMILT
jgi:hypothetical protein